MHTKGTVFKGSLLIAGTSIGGGMLALPVLTGLGGFVPSLFVYLACWFFMATTGLLFLEISLWMKGDANIISMAEATLGPIGKFFAWIIYIFLFYSLTLAYVVGCGNLIVELSQGLLPTWTGALIFVLLFAPFVYAGAHVIGPLNVLLMAGLAFFYCAFVFLGAPHIQSELLTYSNWPLSVLALPVAFTAFAYQGTIPTLVYYMDFDYKKIRQAILIGSFIPFITYVIWQALILGIVPPEGPNSLAEALEKGQTAVQPLKNLLNTQSIYVVGQFFAFFALTTSFFGVTLGLRDFLADGFKWEKTAFNKFILCLLIFIPPLILSYSYPHVFLMALDMAGGFGCALLLGLMPVLMVWSGRYHLHWKSPYSVWGGRPLLMILIAFVLFEVACEITFLMRH